MREPVNMFGNQGSVQKVWPASHLVTNDDLSVTSHSWQSLDDAALAVRGQLLQNPKCPVQNPQATIILVVLPQNAAVLRREVKQWSDMLRGVPTQCVVCTAFLLHNRLLLSVSIPFSQRQGKYEKSNDQYCNNLALKYTLVHVLHVSLQLTSPSGSI